MAATGRGVLMPKATSNTLLSRWISLSRAFIPKNSFALIIRPDKMNSQLFTISVWLENLTKSRTYWTVWFSRHRCHSIEEKVWPTVTLPCCPWASLTYQRLVLIITFWVAKWLVSKKFHARPSSRKFTYPYEGKQRRRYLFERDVMPYPNERVWMRSFLKEFYLSLQRTNLRSWKPKRQVLSFKTLKKSRYLCRKT